jgi:hypothetical protein
MEAKEVAISKIVVPRPAVYIYLSQKDIEELKKMDAGIVNAYIRCLLRDMYGPITSNFVNIIVKTESEIMRFLTVERFINFISSLKEG